MDPTLAHRWPRRSLRLDGARLLFDLPANHLHEPNVFQYCGELGEEQCNRCIAWNVPFGARDIREWRTGHAWFAENAARVICPSKDVKSRVARYFPRANLIVVPHEPNPVELVDGQSAPGIE